MARPVPSRLVVAIAVGGLSYPALVYFGLLGTAPALVVLFGVLLIVLRLVAARRTAGSGGEAAALLLVAAALLGLLAVSPPLAAKAYPAAISFAFAALFLLSVIRPPTIVERIARVREPDLPPAGVAYTRKVTILWIGFLVMNGAISVATSLWGSLGQWMLWNGLLSYLATGALFAGEYLVRRLVRR